MIELKQVSFLYGKGERECGLSKIDLTIRAGEFLLLCGESGCGKTTLTRLINGLIPNYYEGKLEGQVLVGGIDVSKAPMYETAGMVGSVFQNPRSQFFNVDTTSELAFGCENMGLDPNEIRKRVRRTVDELELDPLMNRSIFALSGGEKQKIACGSAAALDPQVFVLDEPSSNLDTAAVEELRILLRRWKRQGKTIVIAEHRLYYLRDLIDRVVYMESGRILREYGGREFAALKKSELDLMGLRALTLESLSETVPKPLCVEDRVSTEDRIQTTDRPQTDDRIQTKDRSMKLSRFIFSYPRRPDVLHIDSVDIPQNAIIAVVGHNGAGKSTLARCLCAMERKFRGSIIFDGESLTGKQCLKRCYMVMQDVNRQLFAESVLDEVLISMEKEDPRIAEAILEGLDLLSLKECHPMALSGGQKQRVAIAAAIASGRKLMVFDEPTSGLDLKHMKEVAQNLRRLAAMGKSVFVITHDPEFILSCCTHVLQLEAGRIVCNEPLNAGQVKKTLAYFTGISEKENGYKEKVVYYNPGTGGKLEHIV